MPELEPKDRVQLVLKLYELECADNSELYRRGGLLISGIVFIGTASAALANTSQFMKHWPSAGSMLELLAMIGVFGAIFASIGYLIAALRADDWPTPDIELLAARATDDVVKEICSKVARAAAMNASRFHRLHESIRWVSFGLAALAIQAVIAGIGILYR